MNDSAPQPVFRFPEPSLPPDPALDHPLADFYWPASRGSSSAGGGEMPAIAASYL
jgi:hypothetical protein